MNVAWYGPSPLNVILPNQGDSVKVLSVLPIGASSSDPFPTGSLSTTLGITLGVVKRKKITLFLFFFFN